MPVGLRSQILYRGDPIESGHSLEISYGETNRQPRKDENDKVGWGLGGQGRHFVSWGLTAKSPCPSLPRSPSILVFDSGFTHCSSRRTMGYLFSQFLISDPWNNGRFEYTTVRNLPSVVLGRLDA